MTSDVIDFAYDDAHAVIVGFFQKYANDASALIMSGIPPNPGRF